jgi:hypothetical protein
MRKTSAMRKAPIVLSLVLFGAAAAAEEIDKVLEADPRSRVSVSIISGSIEVEGWERNEVRVTGSYEEDVEEFIFDRDGREITIRIKAPERSWGQKDISAYLVIRVPRESALDIGVVSSDIDVSGVRGEQELQSVSGDITTEGYESPISAGTVSGDVDVSGAGGSAKSEWDLSSVSGDINARGLSGEVEAEVVSGDIEIDGGTFSRMAAETVSGDISFAGSLPGEGRLDMESVNGSIDIEFAGEISARFDIETFNGRIKNCFGPKPERTSKYAPGIELSFTEGSGEGRVSVSTLNGSLTLCKR